MFSLKNHLTHSHRRLLTFGIPSLVLYFCMTGLSRQFNWGEGYADRPILTYLAIYFALFLLYAVAIETVSQKTDSQPSALWLIVVLGLLFRAAILPANQIQEDDVYRYLWDGKVFANGINPYKYAPEETDLYLSFKIQDPENFEKTYDLESQKDLDLLNGLKWQNENALRTLERVNHADVPTIYPPMAQFIFRATATVQPDSILAMRLTFLLFDLIALFFIVKVLTALGKNRNLCLIYFWCPLVIKETFNSTHLDVLGVAFLCAAIYFLIVHRHLLAHSLLAFSFLVKLYPLILLPLFLQRAAIDSRQKNKPFWRAPLFLLLVFSGWVIVCYLPFLDSGLKTFEGLKTFSTYWQSNDSLFSLLVYFFTTVLGENLTAQTFFSNDLATFSSKITVVAILIGAVIYLLARKGIFQKSNEELLRDMFVLMSLVFLLSPVQNPWYLTWVVPFMCLFPWRSWILLTGLTGLYYLDFYFDYQDVPHYSQWIPWFEYTPFYIYLAFELWKNRERKINDSSTA
jgi:Glycosyltransferase family 87